MFLFIFSHKGYAETKKKPKDDKTILVIGDSIAYGMSKGKKSYTGVDDGEKSAKLIVDCLKKLAKKSGCRVYYVNTLPYVHKGRYKNREKVMMQHNKLTRDGFEKSDVTYVDAYKIVKSVKQYHKQTSDGIHYSKKVYNAVFSEILSLISNKKEELK